MVDTRDCAHILLTFLLIMLSSALHLAIREKADYNLIRILVKNGADLESLNFMRETTYTASLTPLFKACPLPRVIFV